MPRASFQRNLLRVVVLGTLLLPAGVGAQGTREDYARADSFAARTRGLVTGVAEEPVWVAGGGRFWYRKSVAGGNQFVLVDAATGQQRAPFDHDRLAASLRAAGLDSVSGVTLPFTRFSFTDDDLALEFVLADTTWRCALSDYACACRGAVPRRGGGAGQAWSAGPGSCGE